MIKSETPLMVRSSTKIVPGPISLPKPDAWTSEAGNSYQPLTPSTESNTSQLSVGFDDQIIDIRYDPIVRQLQVDRKVFKNKCPWKVPWVAITNCFIQITLFTLQNKPLFDLLIYSPRKKSEIWRFLTYSLLHSDVVHLIVNVFLQILTAFALETEQGHHKVLTLYLAGILAGSLGTSVFQKNLLIVGSSAGVYCLLLSHIAHLVLNFSSLPYRYYRIISVMVICLNDILLTTLHCVKAQNEQPKIGLAAHISGGLSGLTLGFTLYSGERISCLSLIRFLTATLYCCFVISAILLNLSSNINK